MAFHGEEERPQVFICKAVLVSQPYGAVLGTHRLLG